MAIQMSIPGAVPADAIIVSPRLAIWKGAERVIAYSAADPIYTCRVGDRDGLRLMGGMLSALNLASDRSLAQALDTSREAIRRHRKLLERGGADAVRAKKTGPKRAFKLTGAVRTRAQRLLDKGLPVQQVACEVGLTEGTLRYAIKQGRLTRPTRTEEPEAPSPQVPIAPMYGQGEKAVPQSLSGPSERAAEDQACDLGVGTKRETERVLARFGMLTEALPQLKAAEAVPSAGVLLALPVLLEQGLIDVGQSVYGSLKNGFFGLRTMLLVFCFMSLLRIKTPEEIKTRAPGELGLLLGMDRAPVVETVRRKLAQMGRRGLALVFQKRLTERWVESDADQLGILYIDGHVRVYNGRKHELPKLHVQKRGRPMPGTQDFHVNDRRADPLFCVTAEATEGLVTMIDQHLVPEIQRLVGPERRVTIAFDRQGWSPKHFKSWYEQGFDVLTYRKGEYGLWRTGFEETTQVVDGRKVTYELAERPLTLSNGLSVREIRRKTEDDHQTSVITTNESLSTFDVAYRMFNRWSQENFFRYMRQEFALDHMPTWAVEPADPQREVSNPERKKLEKELKKANDFIGRITVRRGTMKPGTKIRVQGRTLTEDDVEEVVRQREQKATQLKSRIEKLPAKLPIDQILDEKEIVRLERERKRITDAFKMIAYRAESDLARLIEPFFKRHEDEARNFLQTVFQATADLVPDEPNRTLTVRFHGLSNPRTTRALHSLCAIVTESNTYYPGTDLRMRFEAPSAT